MGLKCPNCDEKIDKKYFWLERSLSRYGMLKKVQETTTHIMVRAHGEGKRHFVFKKDRQGGIGRKRSFRVRDIDALIEKSYNELDDLERILYTSDGFRYGELEKEISDDMLKDVVARDLEESTKKQNDREQYHSF